MAFVRNWIDAIDQGRDQVEGLVSGHRRRVGHFGRAERVGFQVFGSQHIAALGDLQMAEESDAGRRRPTSGRSAWPL